MDRKKFSYRLTRLLPGGIYRGVRYNFFRSLERSPGVGRDGGDHLDAVPAPARPPQRPTARRRAPTHASTGLTLASLATSTIHGSLRPHVLFENRPLLITILAIMEPAS